MLGDYLGPDLTFEHKVLFVYGQALFLHVQALYVYAWGSYVVFDGFVLQAREGLVFPRKCFACSEKTFVLIPKRV